MTVAVFIPTLDEADTLVSLLADLAAQVGIEPIIVVADGGSNDATTDVAQRHGIRCIAAPTGRARQMNAGRQANCVNMKIKTANTTSATAI